MQAQERRERDKYIHFLAQRGWTQRAIARVCGLQRASVHYILHRPNFLPPAKFTDNDQTIIRHLFKVGKSYGEIAHVVGRTRNSIAGYCRRNGLRRK